MQAQASFARAIETDSEGKSPRAVRLWRAGLNRTDKGNVRFSPRSARMVMAAYKRRGNPLVFDYEHESMLAADARGGSAMKGVAATKHAELEVRNDERGQPELWATNIEWTDEAKRQIESGERRQISPWCAFDKSTREVTEIINCALCREGATHFGTLLASRTPGRAGTVDELLGQLEEAIGNMDWETAESLIQQLESADGSTPYTVRMARYAMQCAKGDDGGTPPPPPPPPPGANQPPKSTEATTKLAASINAGLDAIKAATERATLAANRSNAATVRSLIAANRDFFDAVDERQHIKSADPDATERHIASMRRKAGKGGTGTLAANRDGTTQPGTTTTRGSASPPRDGGGVKTDAELEQDAFSRLTPAQVISMDQYNRGQSDPKKKLTARDMAASLDRNAPRAKGS